MSIKKLEETLSAELAYFSQTISYQIYESEETVFLLILPSIYGIVSYRGKIWLLETYMVHQASIEEVQRVDLKKGVIIRNNHDCWTI